MKRTTIMLPDDLDLRVRYEARRRGVSIADVAREALDEHVPRFDGKHLSFIAIGEGPGDDISNRLDEVVAEAINRRFDDERSSR